MHNTKLVKIVHSEADSYLLQEDINNLEQWCSDWNLPLNAQKCTAMCLSLSSTCMTPRNQYCINATVIELQIHVKSWGLLFIRLILTRLTPITIFVARPTNH